MEEGEGAGRVLAMEKVSYAVVSFEFGCSWNSKKKCLTFIDQTCASSFLLPVLCCANSDIDFVFASFFLVPVVCCAN